MANTKDNHLFNHELKDKFLSSINEETQPSYRRILIKTRDHEEALNKDVNSFSFTEIEAILRSFESTSKNTVESYGRIISSYLNWCVKNGLINKNVMEDMRPDDFHKYVKGSDYITEKELEAIENQCINYQDAVILRLLFIGVSGKALSELRNLKVEDVDFDNKRLRLVNTLKSDDLGVPTKFTERYIDADDRTMKLIEGAIEQEIYLKSNGEMVQTSTNNVRPYTDLIKNDYVIRTSLTQTDAINEPADKYVVYRRLSMLEKIIGIEKFNAKFIQQSGMIYYAKDLADNNGEIHTYDLKIVANRFNIRTHYNLKSTVTAENIKRLYPESFKG